MELQCYRNTGVTILDNTFIDRYIADANGEYVKVYLYLMRAAQGGLDVTVTSVADALEHTEKDILRALRYWQKCGLLDMQETRGQVESIRLLSPEQAQPSSGSAAAGSGRRTAVVRTAAQTAGSAGRSASAGSSAASASGSDASDADASASGSSLTSAGSAASAAIPANKLLPAARRRSISAKEEFKQLLFVAEQYFNRPLTPAEINDLMYFYDTLHFSCDLIECLLECCLDKGDRGPGYMEAVAQSWYTKGITTPEEAKKENKRHNEEYYTILRALGISDHRPVDKEIEVMDRWLHEYAFSPEVICEACERTIMRIHKPEFGYVETILKSWHEKGVKGLSDIRSLDEAHSAETAEASAAAGTASSSSGTGRARRSSSSRFSNFDERRFDWNALAEQELVTNTNEGN